MKNNSQIPSLLTLVLMIATQELGVKEDPPFSNRGKRITEFLASVGMDPGNPWCMAYVFWCFEQACALQKRLNPVIRTASCLQHWNMTRGERILPFEFSHFPEMILPGDIFIIDRGHGMGHTGLVTSVGIETIQTIEGNASTNHSLNGDRVAALERRIDSINKGFIRYC
jgi:hypothetical protein